MSKPKIEIDKRTKRCPLSKDEELCMNYWRDCAWAIEKDRVYPDGSVYNLKCCSMFLNADEHENSNNRLFALQAEMGELKNAAIFQAGTILHHLQSRKELHKIVEKHIRNIKELPHHESETNAGERTQIAG